MQATKSPPVFLLAVPGRGRCVLFPVAARENDTVVFATCSHTVDGLDKYEARTCDVEGHEVGTDKGFRTLILPRALGTDLAFVIQQLKQVPLIVRLSERTIAKGSKLSHVRNVMFRSDFKDQTHLVTEQSASPLSRRFAYVEESYREPKEQIAALGQRLKNPLRALAMRSVPGVSGSPLWDQYGNVLGMVCGGNEELTESEKEYFLVYLPAKEIKRNLVRFDSKINTAVASIKARG
jgi:hypothetical protein